MKPGTLIVKIIMWIFFFGAIAYFAVYAYHVLFTGYESAALYAYTAQDSVQAAGCMIRTEQALEGGSELQEVTAAEGETVAPGDTLAVIYENQKALSRHLEIKELESRLESLQYILSHSADDADSVSLNGNILNTMVEIRALTATGVLTDLEPLTSQLRTLLFRRDYTYSGSDAITEEISGLVEHVEDLASENRSYTTTITAECSGTFSSLADGYEEVLTPDCLKTLTPRRLDELLDQRADVNESTCLGKLVTSPKWFFAATLDASDAERLVAGESVTLRFNSMARTLRMNVDSISDPDSNSQVCVVFSSSRYLAETTLLRRQSADIIFDSISGYRVDKSAVHVQNENGDIGVYRIYGAQAIWVPIEILWEEEDHYLIRQRSPDGENTEQSELDQARQLRAGSEIIVKGTNLYDGKVVR